MQAGWLYSFGDQGKFYEGVVRKDLSLEEIACLFKDPHLGLIEINGVLYGRNGRESWCNNYVGVLENWLGHDGPAEEYPDPPPYAPFWTDEGWDEGDWDR